MGRCAQVGQLHDVKAAITGMTANGVWQLAWNTPPRSSPISRMARDAAAAAFLEDRALQGDWICGDAMGFAHPPRRRRARQHRQQFGRTVPARDRAHQKEFPAPGSEGDGDRAAVLYTVLETTKLNGLAPEVYLVDVIDRMAKGHPINRPAELLPWNWTQQAVKLAA